MPWSCHVEVPLATFTGWNLRLPGCAEQDLASLNGSYLPFAKIADERSNGGNPRPSLQERYRSRVHYGRAIAVVAQRLVEQRLSLKEDTIAMWRWRCRRKDEVDGQRLEVRDR